MDSKMVTAVDRQLDPTDALLLSCLVTQHIELQLVGPSLPHRWHEQLLSLVQDSTNFQRVSTVVKLRASAKFVAGTSLLNLVEVE